MKKILKKYKPYKNIIYLYFSIPLILNAITSYSSNEDIWYMMKYGEYILKKGFIHTDVLSMHSNFHIVIQQSFTNIIYYIIYKFLGSYGIFLFLELIIILYLYLLYKLCMKMCNNKLISVILSIITVVFLQSNFITPRSQIFTYLFVIILLYIMESFYKNNNTKLIYFLPLLSLLQINLHGALWYILFILMIPYVFQLIIDKNKKVFNMIIIMIIIFIIGFINPYTYENVFFPFTCYSTHINKFINELKPINLIDSNINIVRVSYFFYITLGSIILLYIYYKKGKLEIRHLLLLIGTAFMSLINIRSMPFFLLATIPMLSNYLKNIKIDLIDNNIKTQKTWSILIIIILVLSILNKNRLISRVDKGANYLKNNYSTNIILYNTFDYGPYLEYLDFHPYIDTRAEAFLKKTNKNEDIFNEMLNVEIGNINYENFIKKYKFTHFIIYNKEKFYFYLKNNPNYKEIFKENKYSIFEKVN